MTNREIAALFVELAEIMELAGENHFKIRSYRKAAENIGQSKRSIKDMTPDEIKGLPGIGKAILEKISEALKTGTFPTLEKWRASHYVSFLPILKIREVTAIKLGSAIKN